jgi:hypothetical protein
MFAQEQQTNNELELWKVFSHNMRLIEHDLRDKWILDSGATTIWMKTENFWIVPNASSHQSPDILITRENLWQLESAN